MARSINVRSARIALTLLIAGAITAFPAATTVAAPSGGLTVTISDDRSSSEPAVAISADGERGLALWIGTGTDGLVAKVSTMTRSGGRTIWSAPEELAPARNDMGSPDVALSSNGSSAVAVWVADTGYLALWEATWTAGAFDWYRVDQDTGAANPRVAINADGTLAAAVWESGNTIIGRYRSSNVWALASNLANNAGNVSLAIRGEYGVAAWDSGIPQQVAFESLTINGWQGATTIADTCETSIDPDVATDGALVAFVWQCQTDDGEGQIYLHALDRESEVVLFSQDISGPGQVKTSSGVFASIAIHDDGVLVAWTRTPLDSNRTVAEIRNVTLTGELDLGAVSALTSSKVSASGIKVAASATRQIATWTEFNASRLPVVRVAQRGATEWKSINLGNGVGPEKPDLAISGSGVALVAWQYSPSGTLSTRPQTFVQAVLLPTP